VVRNNSGGPAVLKPERSATSTAVAEPPPPPPAPPPLAPAPAAEASAAVIPLAAANPPQAAQPAGNLVPPAAAPYSATNRQATAVGSLTTTPAPPPSTADSFEPEAPPAGPVRPMARRPRSVNPLEPIPTPKNDAAARRGARLATPGIENIKKLREMPPAYRAEFPAITVDVHAYNDDVTRSFVMLSGKRYKAGDTIAEGPRIADIVPEGIIFDWRGERVLYSLNR
jgi:general secretion pathway protein B